MSDMMPSRLERAEIRDLSKGMFTTVPPVAVPEGGFISVKNMVSTLTGLQRRDSWRMFFPTKEDFGRVPVDVANGEFVTDMCGFVDTTNTLQMLAFSTKRLYVNKIGDAFETVKFGKSPYTITSTGAGVVNCSGATFLTDRVRTGDVAVFDVGGVATEVAITGVNSETQLLVASVPVGYGSALNIIREFSNPYEDMVDFAPMPGAIAIVDGSPRGVWKYNGTNLVDMKVTGSSTDISAGNGNYLLGARTVMFFMGYLMLGNTIEAYADGSESPFDYKRTLRWSSVTQINEFAIKDYVIFTKETSGVVKVTSVEECPVVFLEDAIYFGSPSDLVGLPWNYNRVEMGKISAVGKRAMCAVPGGMVFIGQKNIYRMDMGNQGTRVPQVSPIGNAIYNVSCLKSADLKFERAFYSPSQGMLYCAFPGQKGKLGNLFCLSSETDGWTCITDVSNRFVSASVFPYYMMTRWRDYDAKSWSDMDAATWFSLKLEDNTSRVFVIDANGYVYVADNSYDWDDVPDGTAINDVDYQCELETGDLEFGSAGIYKVVTQIYLTVSDVATSVRTSDLTASVHTSVDRGVTWKERAQITIEAGTFFEDAHMRTAAPTVRFKLVFNAKASLFVLNEIGIKYRMMGSVAQRGD